MDYTHTGSLVDTLEPYTMFVEPFSDIWQCLWHREPFHAFRIGCSAKTFNGWLPLNVFAGWLCPTCVMQTWVPSWIVVILIWYHCFVICMLVTIFNWWLSSNDMKLRVLIKELLVVFHWLTFRIIYNIYEYKTILVRNTSIYWCTIWHVWNQKYTWAKTLLEKKNIGSSHKPHSQNHFLVTSVHLLVLPSHFEDWTCFWITLYQSR